MAQCNFRNATNGDVFKLLFSSPSIPSSSILNAPTENTAKAPENTRFPCCERTEPVTEFHPEILDYLRSLETKMPIRKVFLKNNTINPLKRRQIVDWLILVQVFTKLEIETIHHSVTIMDRYLHGVKDLKFDDLQLVAASALLIASKYSRREPPSVEKLSQITGDAYSKDHILQMELHILKTLDYTLEMPLALQFLRIYNQLEPAFSEDMSLPEFMLDVALIEYEIRHMKPSLIAAGAFCLSIAISRHVTNPSDVWTYSLVVKTGYKYLDFDFLVCFLIEATTTSLHDDFGGIRLKYGKCDWLARR